MKSTADGLIDLIGTSQNADGSFGHLSSSHPDFLDTKTYTSPFFTALILECLVDVTHPKTQTIKQKAANFLRTQISASSSVNYWVRESVEMQMQPYPDDLDDTMLTLSALQRYDARLLSTEQILASITLLTTLEVAPGGPYRTWMTGTNDARWRDVDIAVNANVAYFLSLLKIENKTLRRYIRQVVGRADLVSPYYPTSWPILFYISRSVTGGTRSHILDLALLHRPTTLLDTSLLVLTLINVKTPLKTLEPFIAGLQNVTDDTLLSAPFCFDPAINNVPYFAGSTAVTAAFCLAALTRYQEYEKKLIKKRVRHATEQRILRLVRKECSRIIGQPDSRLFKELSQLHRDYQSHRILLTTHDFERALRQTPPLSEDAADQLGMANLFGWYAYSIFDDIMDDNQSHEKLPLALRARDACLEKYHRVFDLDSDYLDYIAQTLTKTHEALVFEVEHLRFSYNTGGELSIHLEELFPFHVLAERAYGHVLGPLGLFNSLFSDIRDPLFQELETFYRHFLITRQMLDDAHDWKDDFIKGQLNSVSYEMLRELNISHITSATVSTMHTYFWETYFPVFCEQALEHVDLCKRAASKLVKLVKPEYFSGLLDPLEKQITSSLLKHRQTQELIEKAG